MKKKSHMNKATLLSTLLVIPLFFVVNGVAEEVKLQRAVPLGILNRVYQISYKEHSGSCFVIDKENRQYIITARHLVPDIVDNDPIRIFVDGTWRIIIVKPIFPESENSDIVALAGNKLVAPKMDILLGSGGIYVGQDVYFLGFPFGLATKFEKPSPVHIAFIKKAILSAIDARPNSGHILYLDGHNNPGFSGGPVIFANYNKKEQLQIAGVVSAYRHQPIEVLEAILEETESSTGESSKKVVRYVKENTGIVLSYSFSEIEKAIDAHPIGFTIPVSTE